MAQAVGEDAIGIRAGWERDLLDGFIGDLKDAAGGSFLQRLNEIFRQVTTAGGDVSAWHGAVSVLRQEAVPYLDGAALQRVKICGTKPG